MARRKTKEERERERRRREAAKAIKGLLARLRKGCQQFESVDAWYEFVRGRVKPVAEAYADVLPEDTVRTMREADRLVESTRAAVQAACQVLTGKLEQTLLALTAGLAGAGLFGLGTLGTVVAGGVVVAAIVAGGIAWAVRSRGAQITVRNVGCPTIAFPAELADLERIPGVELPERIETDEEAEISLPLIEVELEAGPEGLVLHSQGLEFPIPLPPELRDLRYDGESVFGREPVALERGAHTLELICR